MPSPPPDAFARLAAQFHLQLLIEPLVGAPRDVLNALDESDQFYLVTVMGRDPAASLRSVFIKPAADPAPPDVRDVLWWLAADAGRCGIAVATSGGGRTSIGTRRELRPPAASSNSISRRTTRSNASSDTRNTSGSSRCTTQRSVARGRCK